MSGTSYGFGWNDVLCNTCACGNKNFVYEQTEIYGKNSCNWNYGLVGVCNGSNPLVELLDFCINNGANNLNEGLACACRRGYEEIAKILISKGADDYNRGLKNIKKEHTKLALFIIIKGANINNCEIDLNFEDIYYLLHNKIKEFGKFDNIAHECKKWKIEFKNVVNELFIKDVANLLIVF